jgi:hypothetical protein
LAVGLAVGLAEGLFARNRHRYRHALGKPTADCTVSAQAKAIQRYRTHRNGRFLTDDYIKMLKTFADLVPKSAQLIVMDDRFFNAG